MPPRTSWLICVLRAPTAFMMPISRDCRARLAARTAATRIAASTSESTARLEEHRQTDCDLPLMGMLSDGRGLDLVNVGAAGSERPCELDRLGVHRRLVGISGDEDTEFLKDRRRAEQGERIHGHVGVAGLLLPRRRERRVVDEARDLERHSRVAADFEGNGRCLRLRR